MNQRKQDLERRLKLANSDKSNLSAALEEAGDKILHLENLLNDKEAKLGELANEVHELRDSGSWLANELETMISMNEKLAQSEAEAEQPLVANSQRKRSQLIDQLKELRLRNQSRLKANEYMLISRRQAINGAQTVQAAAAERRRLKRRRDASLLEELESSNGRSSSVSPDSKNPFDDPDAEQESSRPKVFEWREEIASEVYALLRRFQANLQQRRDALSQSSSPASFNAVQAGQHLYSPNSTDDSGISADEGE